MLKEIFPDERDVKVKKVELSIRELDDSVTLPEVATAITIASSCNVEDVRTGVLWHRSHRDMGTMWV